MSDLAQEAHDYAAMGWHVFPLQPRQKKPYAFTTGLKAASADVELVSAWWAGRGRLPLREPKFEGERLPRAVVPQPTSNIGLQTGAASGVVVLDVDGAAGVASLQALAEKHGRLPATVRQVTGSGGGQLFYAWPGVLPWGVEIRNSASKAALGDHLDVRGAGGYVVLPPSIHPGDEAKGIPPGGVYRWVEGAAPWECGLARAPWWLLRLMAPPPAPQPAQTFERREPGPRGQGYARGALTNACEEIAQAKPGLRNQTLHRNAYGIGRLVAAGELKFEVARQELIEAGLRMGAGDKEYGIAQVAFHVDNAFRRAASNPRRAPQ